MCVSARFRVGSQCCQFGGCFADGALGGASRRPVAAVCAVKHTRAIPIALRRIHRWFECFYGAIRREWEGWQRRFRRLCLRCCVSHWLARVFALHIRRAAHAHQTHFKQRSTGCFNKPPNWSYPPTQPLPSLLSAHRLPSAPRFFPFPPATMANNDERFAGIQRGSFRLAGRRAALWLACLPKWRRLPYLFRHPPRRRPASARAVPFYAPGD